MFSEKNKKNYLNRNVLIHSFDSEKIWSKSLNIADILDLLNQLIDKISSYDFELDNNFIMNERRNNLKNSIFERISNTNNQYEYIIKESLFNLWEFINDEYDGDLMSISKKLNIPLKDVISMCDKYRLKNIISLQEKDIIVDIINEIKKYINIITNEDSFNKKNELDIQLNNSLFSNRENRK